MSRFAPRIRLPKYRHHKVKDLAPHWLWCMAAKSLMGSSGWRRRKPFFK